MDDLSALSKTTHRIKEVVEKTTKKRKNFLAFHFLRILKKIFKNFGKKFEKIHLNGQSFLDGELF